MVLGGRRLTKGRYWEEWYWEGWYWEGWYWEGGGIRGETVKCGAVLGGSTEQQQRVCSTL